MCIYNIKCVCVCVCVCVFVRACVYKSRAQRKDKEDKVKRDRSLMMVKRYAGAHSRGSGLSRAKKTQRRAWQERGFLSLHGVELG